MATSQGKKNKVKKKFSHDTVKKGGRPGSDREKKRGAKVHPSSDPLDDAGEDEWSVLASI